MRFVLAVLTYEQRVPDDVPPFSSPILGAGNYWLYTFREEGVYDVVCAPHEYFGMAGRIVAGSAAGPGANPVGEAPENVVSEGSVSWEELAPESKRPLLRPVEGEE